MQNLNFPRVFWLDGSQRNQARWRSEAGLPAPEKVILADDRLKADAALRLAREGASILWQGDYQNARFLLQAMARRLDRAPRAGSEQKPKTAAGAFQQHRQRQGERAQLLARLLVPLTADYRIPLARGQAVQAACREVFGEASEDSVLSLRELLAVISAHEWRKKGIPVPAVEGRIYPHYGVFSPVRGEYVDLLATAPLPAGCELAFDIGTGTGLLAFAALKLWPRAFATASDIDDACVGVVRDNTDSNGFTLGARAGELPERVCGRPGLALLSTSRASGANSRLAATSPIAISTIAIIARWPMPPETSCG